MISSGELYDWSEELKDADEARLRAMCRELIDDHHRLRSLVEELATFRHTVEHDRTMASLDRLIKKLDEPGG